MLWMITDFSKNDGIDDAISHISRCLECGTGKVTLRNKGIYSEKSVCEIKSDLDGMFPDKEIFFHDPSDAEIEKFDHFHFSSKRINDAIVVKKKFPEKTIALSTHSRSEYEKAFENGIDYAFFSPVFKPLSKPDDLRDLVEPVKIKNLYLLGGIDKMKALLLIEKGCCDLAGISLFYGENAAADIRELSLKIMEKEYDSTYTN